MEVTPAPGRNPEPAREPSEPRAPLAERMRLDVSWRDLTLDIYAATGERLLEDLMARLTDVLDAALAFIGEVVPDDAGAVDTVALCADGRAAEHLRYRVAGGPFEAVLTRGATCCFAAGVAERFPDDALLRDLGAAGCIGLPLVDVRGRLLGLIAVASRRPLEASDVAVSVLRLFAARVAAELARRSAERELAQAQALLHSLTESTPDLIYVKDLEGRYVLANAAAAVAAGLPAGQIVGRLDGDIFPERLAAAVRANDQRVLAEGRPQIFEETAGSGPSRRVVQSFKAPFRAPDGQVLGVLGVSRDITLAKRAEESRATLLKVAGEIAGTLDRAELIRRVQEHTAAGIPCDRVITYYRSGTEGPFGIVGHLGLPPDLLQESLELRFLPGEPIIDASLRGEVAMVHATDEDPLLARALLEHFRVAAVATAPLVVRGRVLGLLAAVRNQRSVERRFATEDLQLLESIARQLAVALEAADLFEARDREAHIASALAHAGQELLHALDAPDMLERLCRITTEAMGSASSFTFLYDQGADAYVPVASFGARPGAWDAVRLSQIRRDYNLEMVATLASGRVAWLGHDELPAHDLGALARGLGVTALAYVPLRRGGEVAGVQVAVYRDERPMLTPSRERIANGLAHLASLAIAHRAAIQELERANAIKSDFVATMSHELRTPLNVIIGYDDLLVEGAFGALDEAHAGVLRRIGLAARELMDLVDNTLNLSRIDAVQAAIDASDVSLAELLEEIALETRELGDGRGIGLTIAIDRDVPALRSDRGKLKLVLKNLVTNALKFTERGGVSVSARGAGGELEIEVRDTGIGIPPEMLPLIFEAFRQGDSAVRQSGVGLGLYIVRRLVDVLGGAIAVDSEVGRGSAFTLRLPSAPRGKAVRSRLPTE